MRQANAHRRHADPLHAIRNLLGEPGRMGQQGAQYHERANPQRDPGQPGKKQDALDIEG